MTGLSKSNDVNHLKYGAKSVDRQWLLQNIKPSVTSENYTLPVGAGLPAKTRR